MQVLTRDLKSLVLTLWKSHHDYKNMKLTYLICKSRHQDKRIKFKMNPFRECFIVIDKKASLACKTNAEILINLIG